MIKNKNSNPSKENKVFLAGIFAIVLLGLLVFFTTSPLSPYASALTKTGEEHINDVKVSENNAITPAASNVNTVALSGGETLNYNDVHIALSDSYQVGADNRACSTVHIVNNSNEEVTYNGGNFIFKDKDGETSWSRLREDLSTKPHKINVESGQEKSFLLCAGTKFSDKNTTEATWEFKPEKTLTVATWNTEVKA